MSKSASVLITGGATRFGRTLCNVFSESGWNVLFTYNTSAGPADDLVRSIKKKGREVHAYRLDVASSQSINSLIDKLIDDEIPLQAVINNAALFKEDELEALDEENLRTHIDANFIGPAILSHSIGRRIIPLSAPGCIIQILDQKLYNPNPDYLSYTLAKAGLDRAVPFLAQALSPNWRVCGIAPGLMLPSGPQTDENFRISANLNLNRTPIDVADIGRLCLHVAENPCINGMTILADNGQHLVSLDRDVINIVERQIENHARTAY